MRWKVKPEIFDYTSWHPIFLWRPVIIGEYTYWLCFVKRRAIVPHESISVDDLNIRIGLGGWTKWEYFDDTY